MESSYPLSAFLLMAIVLLFNFINGFNDGTNMMVSPVITGALQPWMAVLLFAAFEFIGPMGFETAGKNENLLGKIAAWDQTHNRIVSSSILGAGSAQSLGSIRWKMGWQIFITWIITIPGTAVISALFYALINRWL